MFDVNIKNRFEICKACPLIKYTSKGAVCNKDLWLNQDTGEVSLIKKEGWVNGCGCHLEHRIENPDAHCVIGKW